VIQAKNVLEPWLNANIVHEEAHGLSAATEWILILISALVALGGLYYGYRFFQQRVLPGWFTRFQTASLHSFYADNFYNTAIVNPLKTFAHFLFGADTGLLRGFGGLGGLVGGIGGWLARLETGYLRFYVAGLLIAAVLLVGWGVLR
jgi:NADH-quinone oxidoreductase subunit L